ncbi:anti-sigma factor [Rahnella sp. C60]|uniref:anti-sigma factor family protein n=1 Tax=Rahnella TaxID=34037 RepID=UPI00101F3EC1|nr:MULTISPECIES: anti-sigma factor [Rahnella]MBU9811765.1 anti-sigma factor [Rahnella perminowiae]MBU9817347.1 anti-sigma factor [Rahnella perminowiae]MBU9825688.1 anti-sigma factor [Rahnella perminowiae]UJD87414.1 anti-sigma factor [Rahnella aquatilis]
MTREIAPAPYADEVLVAYLDNQLSESQRAKFDAQLSQDDVLTRRLAQMSRSNLPFHDAFGAMLQEAPVGKLQAALDAIPDARGTGSPGLSRRALLAASLSFLAVGLLAGRYSTLFTSEDNWRARVADYMSLYTAQTLADVYDSAGQQKIQLARVQNTLGIPLSPAALAVQGADLKDARMLHYDDDDIAQITYLDARYGPMALCITRSKSVENTSLQREIRRGMNVVYWRTAGYNFMLIGHSPATTLAAHAAALQANLV